MTGTWLRIECSLCLGLVCCVLTATSTPQSASAQLPEPSGTAPSAVPGVERTAALAGQQSQLADKYRRLEDLIFKMADFEAASHPRRAALLRQAYKQSKDRLTYSQMRGIAALLQDKKYKRAIDDQEIAHKNLKDLLQLLMSEDRSDRLKSETQKIQDQIKELKRLERMQRGVRGRTEGASDPRELAQDQEKLADRTGDVAEQLEQQEGQNGKSGAQNTDTQDRSGKQSDDRQNDDPKDPQAEDQDSDRSAEDRQPKDDDQARPSQDSRSGQPQQNRPSGQTPRPKDSGDNSRKASQPPSDSQKQSPQGQSQPGQPQPGQPQPGQPQPGAPPQAQPEQEDPASKRVREAEEKMREAQRKLEEAKRDESVEKQTEAVEKLKAAIAELEEILRQLREEEMERVLALLEGRFRKMLEMELKVHEGTLRIGKMERDAGDRKVDIRASQLAFDQRKVAGEADRALTLLREEGSSVAFPEVVEQMRDDMEDVAARLDEVKIGEITQGLEEEIIQTLEEMIAALQKAQQDMEKQKEQRPGQPGSQGEPPLVDALAELKMIRSLQVRVNSRTKRYARLLEDPNDPVGQAMEQDLRRAIGKLSELESRIHQVTRDIALGKNQ